MIKDVMEENAEITPTSREMAVLKEHFPGFFQNDGAFDITRFSREVLEANGTRVTQEGFGLDFLGKNYAKLIASMDTETVIVPDEAHNSLPENAESQNIYISGDNLDALKHLLKSYSGKVKCIYIDPPYNTGSDDFVYNDSFTFTAEAIERKLGIDDEQAKKLLSFTSKGSSSHSAWLTFMYPRLQLAKGLLSDDGVIFISIDDNEQAQLKLISDSIFGEDSLLGGFIWKKRQMVDSRTQNGVSKDHDYLLCYGKNESCLLRGKEADKGKYTNPDNDPRGDWMSADMSGLATESQRPNLHYNLQDPQTDLVYPCPKTGWRYDRARMQDFIAQGEIIFPRVPTGRPRRKKFLRDVTSDYTGFSTILKTVFSTQGTREVRDLFEGKEVFDFPKPVDLIRLVLEQGVDAAENKNHYVLDFFSGSATTAHATMKKNAMEGGNLRYILVQLPEVVKENSEAYKAGFKTVDEIGQERIKRAAKKIREENPLFAGDLGFKHYTLKDVSQNTLDKLETFDPEGLIDDATILDAFGKNTVLETWLVRDGYGFAADVQAVKLKDYTAYWCGRHLYLIDPGFTQDDVAALFKKYDTEGAFSPDHVVLFGYSFTAWSVSTMMEINLRQLKDGAKNLQINIDTRY